jgi:hypothetical protein
MEELKDYSEEFRPDLKLQDFSKDALVRMWGAAAKLYIGIDGLWYTLIKERFGEQTAMELEQEIWRRATPPEAKRAAEALNIQGNDVATCFKTWQVDPGGAGILDLEFDLKNKNHGILTVKHCASLDYFERHGYSNEAIKWMCEIIDGKGFEDYAHVFNPKIEVAPLFLPPRKSRDKIACQWELKLEG